MAGFLLQQVLEMDHRSPVFAAIMRPARISKHISYGLHTLASEQGGQNDAGRNGNQTRHGKTPRLVKFPA